MALFKRRVDRKVNTEQLFVAKAQIVLFPNRGGIPRWKYWYYLVRKEGEEYHELFGGEKIELEIKTHRNGGIIANFDTPYIVNIEPFRDSCTEKTEKMMNLSQLYTFITNKNVKACFGEEKEEDEPDEETDTNKE